MAIGFSALAIPLATMAWAVLLDGGFLSYSLAHLVMSVCFLWVARDLIRWASLVGRHRLPHPSMIALFVAVALVRFTRPPELATRFGSMPGLTVGVLMLGAALVILAIDDRSPNPLVALIGRMTLIAGGAIAGLAEIIRMMRGFREYPVYSLGLGGAGVLLGAMAVFEGRLLRRALALARRRRNRNSI